MKKFDKFFIITLVASLIILAVTSVPQVRAVTTAGKNENTTLTTADSPTTKSTAQQQQQPVQQDQQKQQTQQPIEKQQPIVTPNHRPSANAGPDKKVNEGAIVVLDSSHSTDPDIGNKIIYSWRQIAGRPLVDIGLSSDASTASFTAPDVNRDSTFTFVVSVKDDKGAQDLDTVKVLVKNLDTGTPSTSSNNNAASEQTNTNANVKTNPNAAASESTGLGNTTGRALTNAQKNTGNNIGNIDNGSQLQSATVSTQMTKMSAITVQALLSPLQAFPTNGFVNNRAFYDISFKAATSSTIGQVVLTFPTGTQVSQAAVVEVSGIGDGTFSNSGQTITYTITSPSPVTQGKTIRLQVDYVLNPPTPSPAGGYTIQVTTKDPGGATIDSGSTSGYVIKQIQQQDIGNNQIYSSNIQDGQVATKDIADNAITSAKILDGQVTTNDIADNSVTTTKIAKQAVGTDDILDGAVTSPKIANNAIQSSQIVDGQVLAPDIGADAVGVSQIAADSVGPSEISGMDRLNFGFCQFDFGPISPHNRVFGDCPFGGVTVAGEPVLVTISEIGTVIPPDVIVQHATTNNGFVRITVENIADSSVIDPPLTQFNIWLFHNG